MVPERVYVTVDPIHTHPSTVNPRVNDTWTPQTSGQDREFQERWTSPFWSHTFRQPPMGILRLLSTP